MDALKGYPLTPSSIYLPSASVPVVDADEEIFLLYTAKAQYEASEASKATPASLGFVTANKDLVPISLTIVEPARPPSPTTVKKGKAKRKVPPKQVEIELELHQDLDSLRNRKGDTGSVLWRVSLHLAQFLLAQHHFPPPTPLLPHWSTSRILELGSGTGFLGLALSHTVSHWTFSDQLPSLPLVLKNLRKNVPDVSQDVRELDWLTESADWVERRRKKEEEKWDLVIACDCIYNPSLSLPLARTISHVASDDTLVLVVSELRDPEPLEVFLRAWLELGWTVARVGFGEEERQGIGAGQFVVWAGWREGDG